MSKFQQIKNESTTLLQNQLYHIKGGGYLKGLGYSKEERDFIKAWRDASSENSSAYNAWRQDGGSCPPPWENN